MLSPQLILESFEEWHNVTVYHWVGVSQMCYVIVGGELEVIFTDRFQRGGSGSKKCQAEG